MSLKRWLQSPSRLETDHTQSSAAQADFQRQLDLVWQEIAILREQIAAINSSASPHQPGAGKASESCCGGEAPNNYPIEPTAAVLPRSSTTPAGDVRGRAGGFARVRDAWRYSDGTFMPDREKEAAIEEYEIQQYERYAAGGRVRAAQAVRRSDGTFAQRSAVQTNSKIKGTQNG
jgi:hypothetical protein